MIYNVVHADTYMKTSLTWLWRCKCYQSLQANFYNILATPTQACCPRMESLKNFVYMCHNFLQLTWTCAEFYVNLRVLMHWYTCKSLLNTLGRVVEQLAGCLAKQSKSQQSRSKYTSMQCQHEGLKCIINM